MNTEGLNWSRDVIVFIRGDTRELKRARFWDANGNRKWAIFTFNLPWHHHIHIAKCLFSIIDEWCKNLGDNWVLAREMFYCGCRSRLKNRVLKLPLTSLHHALNNLLLARKKSSPGWPCYRLRVVLEDSCESSHVNVQMQSYFSISYINPRVHELLRELNKLYISDW